MQELFDLHKKILALPEGSRPEEGINFSRAKEDQERAETLPEELQAEVETLRQAINEVVPEDFDYYAFAGDPEEEPSFGLDLDRAPAASSHDGSLQPDRSLIEQLRTLSWDEVHAKAGEFEQSMDNLRDLTERLHEPLRPAKTLQREFRDETRDFIKEKRKDADQIHLMYWDDEHGLMEMHFATAEELREMLPSVIARRGETVTVVAWGKPLPVERIDGLMAQAQDTLRERTYAKLGEAADEADAGQPETPEESPQG